MWLCIIAFALILHPFTYLICTKKQSNIYLFLRIGHDIENRWSHDSMPCYVFMGMLFFCFCLFKRLLQTHGLYKITSNILKKNIV